MHMAGYQAWQVKEEQQSEARGIRQEVEESV
jgi:hypothetical protein